MLIKRRRVAPGRGFGGADESGAAGCCDLMEREETVNKGAPTTAKEAKYTVYCVYICTLSVKRTHTSDLMIFLSFKASILNGNSVK